MRVVHWAALAWLLPGALAAQTTGRVSGVAYDSVAMRPLAGAVVQAVRVANAADSRTVAADSLGRFQLAGLAAGTWAVAALHPRLDSLGLDQIRGTVEVRAGADVALTVAVPEAGRLAQLLCAETATVGDTSGYVVGTLRAATRDRAPVSGTVRVEWLEFTITSTGFARTRETRTADAGPDGRFLLCGVPAGGLVQLSATHGAEATGTVALQLPFDGIQQRDLYVGPSRLESIARTTAPLDSAGDGADSLAVRRGDGRVRGRLVGANGRPLPDARVAFRDAGVEVRTDADGRFAMTALPTGTWNLDARAVGHEPLTRPVDVLADDSTTLSFSMSRLLPLDTVRIRSMMPKSASTNLAAFEERRKVGLGRYMGPDEMVRLDPLQFSDIMLRFPSLRLERADYGYVITMRATGMAPRCAPRVYVDNVLTPNDGTLDGFLPARLINAVEVYSGAFGPPQYMDVLSGCGTILVWTGQRPAAQPARPARNE